MKKSVTIFTIIIISLALIAGVIAESMVSETEQGEIEKKLLDKEKIISGITEVDLTNQPEGLDIGVYDGVGIKIYRVDIGESKPVFIVTSQGKIIEVQNVSLPSPRNLLYFGFAEETKESIYLESATGVDLKEQGYVMLRKGSITGISTSLNAVSGVGTAEIIVYKNGEEAGFRNTISIDSTGIQKDFDLQSPGVLTFKPGDEISVYVKVTGDLTISNIVNIVEITTD
jgi:hypothetical protein